MITRAMEPFILDAKKIVGKWVRPEWIEEEVRERHAVLSHMSAAELRMCTNVAALQINGMGRKRAQIRYAKGGV